MTHVYPIYKGENGERGMSKLCYGKNAESTYIKVPLGTFFRDENGEVLADLREKDDFFLAARGGAGGKGNHHFLSNDNREPNTFEKGGLGEEKLVQAELRVIAHIGLVGFPNAGKSSILRSVTKATPKIGDYAFTTLYPHIGIMDTEDYDQIRIADIPGLIEGAHLNKGLGFSFLRHVEQCGSLIYVIDLSFDNVEYQLEMLKFELEKYQPGLSNTPHIVVGNKIDLQMGQKNFDVLKDSLKGSDTTIIPISARKKINIPELIAHVMRMYTSNSMTKYYAK